MRHLLRDNHDNRSKQNKDILTALDLFRGLVDSGVVQLMLIETGTHYLVDTARIRSRGGLLGIYDARPEHLLRPPLQDYARRLLGLSR